MKNGATYGWGTLRKISDNIAEIKWVYVCRKEYGKKGLCWTKEMMAEYIENVIARMIYKTKNGVLNWKSVGKIDDWENVKKQIERTKEVNLKDYFINDSKSYGVYKNGGYVLVLNICYGNAPVFSPALDMYIFVVKINADLPPQNLSDYDREGYKNLLHELVESIEHQKKEEYTMPDCLYDFLGKILGEDEDGRLINE